MEIKAGKTAVIYSRVSTTEQKDKGFSLGNQERELRRFCEQKGIKIIKEYSEDFSAKTFARPAFSQLMEFCTKNKNKVDYLLVHKWCRFSRNISESYQILTVFNQMGIEVNSSEQWIDFEVPQNILMLSIHLSIPEIDNKDRSNKVIAGSRAALKEGRWIYSQPIGYKSGKDASGKTLMQVDEDKAKVIRKVFEDFGSGSYSQNEIMKKHSCELVKLSKSNLNRMLKNIVYAGKIPIPEYKNEPFQLVDGLHEPLISMELFQRVQRIIGEKCRFKNKPAATDPNLPLRGYMTCPKCGRNLTGSGSLSKTKKKHYYYHCNTRKGCNYRIKAKEAHDQFMRSLNEITPSEEITELFKEMVNHSLDKNNQTTKKQLRDLRQTITEIRKQQDSLLDRLLDKTIDNETYKVKKERIESRLYELKERETNLVKGGDEIKQYLDYAVYFISNLAKVFEEAHVSVKHKILGSILAEKLLIIEGEYRTPVFNNAIALLSKYNNGFKNLDTKKGDSFSTISRNVLEAGLEPARAYAHKILSLACLPIPPLEHHIGRCSNFRAKIELKSLY